MSKKQHCDICDTVINSPVEVTFVIIGGTPVKVEIDCEHRVDFCKECLTDQLNYEDKRPRLA